MYIGDVFEAKMPTTATHDSPYCTCLGHLGQRGKNKNHPICVPTPKVAKASVACTDWLHVTVAGVIKLNFANGNTALRGL
jgi:hypothetical protein